MSRRQKRRKMAAEEDAADQAASQRVSAAIRSAKKKARPGKITEAIKPVGKAKAKSGKRPGAGAKRSAFDDHEGMRAKPTKVNLSKKGKGGGKGGKAGKGKGKK